MMTLLAIACGALVGFALGLVGGGGSILATPLLLYGVGIGPPHVAVGTGAAAVSAAAFFNFANHAYARHVQWRSAILFAVVGVVGALIGSTIGKAVDGQHLLTLFGLLMVIVGALMFRSRDTDEKSPDYGARSHAKVAGLALIAGLASGFFGIGGGFLIVPCLLVATRMPMIDAVGSSLLAVTAFSVATAANYAWSGLVDWPATGLFVIGGIAGGVVGMSLATRLCEQKDLLRRVFAILILIVAAYVIYRGVRAISF